MDSISLVVLTHNRKDEILRTLRKLTALPERVPICVVDNGSTDGTGQAIADAFPRVRLVRLASNMGAAGRNAGARQMRTKYLAFCDDDTWWEPGALTRAVELMEAHPTLAVMTARVLVGPDNREDPASKIMAASPLPNPSRLPGMKVLGFMAGACVVRRLPFLLAGGYEARLFIGGEERLLALDLIAAGWQLAYVPELVVHHHPSLCRDPLHRRQLLLRNALWCAWLRRPLASAWRETRARIAEAGEPHVLWGLAWALAGLPWVLRRRRVIPPLVDRALRTLEAPTA
jgi:GT2 family glycosyltransferase